MTETPLLPAGDLLLRPFEKDDAVAVIQAAEDPYIRLLTGLAAGDRAGADAYIRRQGLRAERDLGFSFAIATATTGRAVGQIGLWLRAVAPDGSTGYREEAHGRASLGYWVGPAHRGHGFAATALDFLAPWALSREDVARLELFIEPSNEASWRTAEHADFHREGLLRSWQQLGDRRRDMYVYSRLPEDSDPAV